MNATAVEKITPLKTDPSDRERRVLAPSLGFLVKWGLFALVGIGVVLSVILGLVQKWLWMRQLDYQGIFWTLLSVKWGSFAVTLIVSVFYLWLNLRFAAKNTNFPQLKRVIVATGDKVVMEPTLDDALVSLFGAAPGQSGSVVGKQAGAQAPLSKATRDQAEAQLADAQKAINALKQLLANPAQ